MLEPAGGHQGDECARERGRLRARQCCLGVRGAGCGRRVAGDLDPCSDRAGSGWELVGQRVEAAEAADELEIEHGDGRELGAGLVARRLLEDRGGLREVTLDEERLAEVEQQALACFRLGERERLAQDRQRLRAAVATNARASSRSSGTSTARGSSSSTARCRKVAATSGAPRAQAAAAAVRSCCAAQTPPPGPLAITCAATRSGPVTRRAAAACSSARRRRRSWRRRPAGRAGGRACRR